MSSGQWAKCRVGRWAKGRPKGRQADKSVTAKRGGQNNGGGQVGNATMPNTTVAHKYKGGSPPPPFYLNLGEGGTEAKIMG